MDDYISKPATPEDLQSALQRWIPEASRAPSARDSLDPAALEGIRASTTGVFAVEIIDLFLRDTPGRVEALRLAAEAGDAASLDRLAHGLRGSAGMIGVLGVAELCSRIEALVEDGHVPEAGPVVERLAAEYQSARQALETERRRIVGLDTSPPPV